jgi:enamine deaminase RidA (YjgF/YER057c/UK114 family)
VPVRCIFALALPVLMAGLALAQQKPRNKADKEPHSQTLPVLKDPPAAIAADTARLTFHLSPLSAKGLLSQQTRDALQALFRANRGAPMVKLRAFVAGNGDARRVQAIVSEIFTDRKQPLPALTTIQVGALPLEGAQVVIESVSEDKKPQNPNGLAFFSSQHAEGTPAALARLQAAAKNAAVAPTDMLRVTCFVGSLNDTPANGDARLAASRAFPSAAADFVQPLRLGVGSSADCEAVGRRGQPLGDPVRLTAEAALVNAPKLIFSGAQMAFGEKEADLRLAFDRLRNTLNTLGAGYQDVIVSNLYPLGRVVASKLPALRLEFFPNPSAATTLIFEGLPSPDAGMAIEVVAAVQTKVAVRN